jgi:hypothetical protein
MVWAHSAAPTVMRRKALEKRTRHGKRRREAVALPAMRRR